MLQEIPIDFSGGLNTTKHPAYIGDNECQAVLNAISFDGSTRLDRRYKTLVRSPVANSATTYAASPVRGSGYGKFGELPFNANSQLEQYVVAIGGDVYLIDLTSASLSYTKVAGSSYDPTQLSEWFFQQFEDHIYAVQSQYGFARKLIGKGGNNTGDWTKLTNPTGPAAALLYSPSGPSPNNLTFAGSTINVLNPTDTTALTAGQWSVTYTGATQVGSLQIDITLAAQRDLSYTDVIQFVLQLDPLLTFQSLQLKSPVEITGYTANALPWKMQSVGTNLYQFTLRLSNIARATRAQTTGLSLTLNAAVMLGTGTVCVIHEPFLSGVWLSISSDANVAPNTNPTFNPLTYAYTYYNSATGFESLPSPSVTIPASSQYPQGEWLALSMVGSVQAGVDKIRVYRVVNDSVTGASVFYRLGEIANGSPTFTDKYPLDIVLTDPILTPFIIPTTGLNAICAWQDRLVLAQGSLLYISREGDPLSFTPLGTVFDPTDPARARTFYADDSRSETILGLVAQDALYIITDKSIRCLYGSGVDDWRLVRMPESEGSHSNRDFWPYRNGVLVLTTSGRLMYENVFYPAPDEVSKKLHPRIGNSGMMGAHLVGVRPDGEIEVRAENGRYFVLDINGDWRSGVHTDHTHSLLYIPNFLIRWIGMNGNLYEGGSDAYQDDDGVPVFWSVTGKRMLIQRERVQEVFLSETPQTLNIEDTTKALYPRITITGEEGSKSYVPDYKIKTVKIASHSKGQVITVQIEGDKDTVLEGLVLRGEGLSRTNK